MPVFCLRCAKISRLDFPGRVHGEHTFFGEPGKQHPDGCHVLFDRGRRGLALEGLNIGGDRDGLNVFEILIPSALTPEKKLLDRPVIGGPCVRVADRDRKKTRRIFFWWMVRRA
jgi:hypothetical protein